MSKGKYFVYQPDGDGCMEFVAQEGAWGPVIIEETIAVKLLNENQDRIKELESELDSMTHAAKELHGTIEEDRDMPCKSLERRMFQTAKRYEKRIFGVEQ